MKTKTRKIIDTQTEVAKPMLVKLRILATKQANAALVEKPRLRLVAALNEIKSGTENASAANPDTNIFKAFTESALFSNSSTDHDDSSANLDAKNFLSLLR